MGWIPTGTFAIPQKTSEFAKKTPNQQKVLKLTLSILWRYLYHKAEAPHSTAKRKFWHLTFSVAFKKYSLDLTLFQYVLKDHIHSLSLCLVSHAGAKVPS